MRKKKRKRNKKKNPIIWKLARDGSTNGIERRTRDQFGEITYRDNSKMNGR